MQGHSISCTVFSALGEDLNAVPAFAEINMNLAVLAVYLAFTAHPPVAHVQAVLDAPALVPWLPPNFEPVVLDPQMVYRNYHPSLPSILKVQDDLAIAGRILARLRRDRTVVGRPDLEPAAEPRTAGELNRHTEAIWWRSWSISSTVTSISAGTFAFGCPVLHKY